jgi:hypothetical protein
MRAEGRPDTRRRHQLRPALERARPPGMVARRHEHPVLAGARHGAVVRRHQSAALPDLHGTWWPAHPADDRQAHAPPAALTETRGARLRHSAVGPVPPGRPVPAPRPSPGQQLHPCRQAIRDGCGHDDGERGRRDVPVDGPRPLPPRLRGDEGLRALLRIHQACPVAATIIVDDLLQRT